MLHVRLSSTTSNEPWCGAPSYTMHVLLHCTPSVADHSTMHKLYIPRTWLVTKSTETKWSVAPHVALLACFASWPLGSWRSETVGVAPTCNARCSSMATRKLPLACWGRTCSRRPCWKRAARANPRVILRVMLRLMLRSMLRQRWAVGMSCWAVGMMGWRWTVTPRWTMKTRLWSGVRRRLRWAGLRKVERGVKTARMLAATALRAVVMAMRLATMVQSSPSRRHQRVLQRLPGSVSYRPSLTGVHQSHTHSHKNWHCTHTEIGTLQ